MEGGSERISTPIRSPSDKDSAVLSRVSVSSSPFGFRKVSFASFVHHAQSQWNYWSFFVLSRFKAVLSPPTGVLRRDSSASSLPVHVGDDFFRSAEEKDDEEWDTDLEMDGEMNLYARLTILFSAEQKSVNRFIYVMEAWHDCCVKKPNYNKVAIHF